MPVAVLAPGLLAEHVLRRDLDPGVPDQVEVVLAVPLHAVDVLPVLDRLHAHPDEHGVDGLRDRVGSPGVLATAPGVLLRPQPAVVPGLQEVVLDLVPVGLGALVRVVPRVLVGGLLRGGADEPEQDPAPGHLPVDREEDGRHEGRLGVRVHVNRAFRGHATGSLHEQPPSWFLVSVSF